MSSASQSASKRSRKRNIFEREVQILLEEVQLVSSWIFSKNNQAITNKKKENKWKEIASKISWCGVAVRDWQDCREKYKKVCLDVINRQRSVRKTRGGLPTPCTYPLRGCPSADNRGGLKPY
jgi:hypothetical protein